MAIAKVILNGVTQMDVTQKTVDANKMLSGATALKNDGTSVTGNIASQAAQTIHPSTTDQTIASGKYLTGTQTIKAVTTTNLTAANIVQGVTVKVGDSTDDDCVASVTGTASGGGGSDADYIAMIERTTAVTSLPAGVTKIGNSAFRNCSSLALTSLPSGVTTIGEYAFTGCSYLALTSLPSGLRSIGTSAFTDCTRIAITSFPNMMTSVGTAAFARCRNILTISCDGTITSLGSNAFNGDSSNPMQLAHVSFPNLAVNSLSTAFGSSSAAQACQLLEDADIGNTKAIAANAFANCNKLQTLIIRKSDAICTLSNVSAFLNTPMRGYNSLTATIYVPSALISTYQTATNWSTIYGEGYVTFAAIEGSQYEL